MPKRTKPNLSKLSRVQKERIRDAYRKAVKAQMDLWNATDEIEKIIGQELDCSADLVEGHACVLDTPEKAMDLTTEDALEALAEAEYAGVH